MAASPCIISTQTAPKRLLSSALGLALASTMAVPFAAAAESAEVAAIATPDGIDAMETQQLDKVNVDGAYSKIKVDQAASPKYTEPLRDTAQTMTVIPQQLIQEQAVTLLRDVLRQNVPGITFGAGEGSSYGDSIFIRGYAATNDIAIDGVRDSANTTHSDPFDIDRIEVVQGSSSVYSGAGAIGGTINLITKTPLDTDFAHISAGIGTADYHRATADINERVGDPDLGMAFRLNAMAHENDVADRDVTSFSRWGLAPSFAFGLGTPTRFTLAWDHQHDRNLPEYGVPLRNFMPVPGVDRENYYGFSNVDKEKIDSDTLTAIFSHDFSDAVTVRNLTRWEQLYRYSVTDASEGRICLAPGAYPLGTNLQSLGTAVKCGGTGFSPLEGVGGATYTPGGPIGNLRDTRNAILANQTDLTTKFVTAGIEHTLVSGLALAHENYRQATGNFYRNPNGTTYVQTPENLYDPVNFYTLPQNLFYTGRAWSQVDNRAVYAFDTLKFNEHWQLGAGVRYESNETQYTNFTATPVATATTSPGPLLPAVTNPLKNDENLFSWRAALVYKPLENGSVYASYGNSKTPSTATVDGSCGVNCSVAPETALNYEVGTKWDFLDDKLGFTAAVFRTDRTNYKVASGDPAVPYQQLDGSARVDGVQLGLTGNITEHWAVFANYAHLRSEVLQSVSELVLKTTGIDAQKGNPLANTPKDSANVWTTYRLGHGWQVGYGANYTSSVYATANNATPIAIYNRVQIPGFVVHNALLGYEVNEKLNLQLNLTNILDKLYYTQLRSVSTTSGWANPGAGRTAMLTASLAL